MATGTDTPWSPEPGEILRVGELVARAREVLEGTFGWVWVEGEISNTRVPASGHAYFTLLDERAQLRAVCFRTHLRLLRLQPRDGLRVLARGRLTVYEPRGDIQMVVEDLEAEGEGLLRLELEERRRRLAAEGLFDAERKRPLPALPRAVGVVTSATGAALRDILQVLARRAPGVHVVVSPARVQGEGAEAELVRALERVAALPEVDVVILGRGGGSAEDLWPFNAEALVRAAAACPKPLIAAVGHETDVTLVDFAADVRAPTPSAGAELAVREWGRWGDQVARVGRALRAAYRSRLRELRARLERAGPRRATPAHRIARLRIGVDRAVQALEGGVERLLRERRAALQVRGTILARHHPAAYLARLQERLGFLERRLAAAAAAALGRPRGALALADSKLAALNPLAVLSRGYSVTRRAGGAVLRDAADCRPGDPVEVLLARGELVATVQETRSGGRS